MRKSYSALAKAQRKKYEKKATDHVRIVPDHKVVKLEAGQELMFIAPEGDEVQMPNGRKTHSKGDSSDAPSEILGPDALGDYWISWGASYDPATDTTTTYFVPSMTRKKVRVRTPFGIIHRDIDTSE